MAGSDRGIIIYSVHPSIPLLLTTTNNINTIDMTQDQWLNFVTQKIKKTKNGYVVSWWLRIDTDLPTAKINYELKKLVKKGLLLSTPHYYGIEYRLPTQTIPSGSNTVTNTEEK